MFIHVQLNPLAHFWCLFYVIHSLLGDFTALCKWGQYFCECLVRLCYFEDTKQRCGCLLLFFSLSLCWFVLLTECRWSAYCCHSHSFHVSCWKKVGHFGRLVRLKTPRLLWEISECNTPDTDATLELIKDLRGYFGSCTPWNERRKEKVALIYRQPTSNLVMKIFCYLWVNIFPSQYPGMWNAVCIISVYYSVIRR